MRPGQPYYLAFLLLGAYQDTMGDLHNLFGRVHEARVVLDPHEGTLIEDVRSGEQAADALSHFGWCVEELVLSVEGGLSDLTGQGRMSQSDAAALLEDYRVRLRGYTYLGP